MGYYTNYEVNVTGFTDEEAADYFVFKLDKYVGEKFAVKKHDDWSTGEQKTTYSIQGFLSERKWYDWESNLKELSTKFQDVLIEVDGNGEEDGDIWKARIKNGESEIVKAEIYFPAFGKIM